MEKKTKFVMIKGIKPQGKPWTLNPLNPPLKGGHLSPPSKGGLGRLKI